LKINPRLKCCLLKFIYSRDSYHDICLATETVDIYIYTTQPYSVALIDLLNTRISCPGFSITIIIKSPAVILHLVDYHRFLFYEKINDYDLFIYQEDDIRVTSTTISTYLQETRLIEKLLGSKAAQDYNVGIVRYEYNFPNQFAIDDKTRQVTENVTRVYWEHIWKPTISNSVASIQNPKLVNIYVQMKNHHQGMYIATRSLLLAWKTRPGCHFNIIRDRPSVKNNPGQPSEGTQRVWMSSHMLYSTRYCNVQQVLPIRIFSQMTVHHLPNKNYRRVGKQGKIDGINFNIYNDFDQGENVHTNSPDLLTSIELHIVLFSHYLKNRKEKNTAMNEYKGITMIDDIDYELKFKGREDYKLMVRDRMKAYEDYVKRGGVMNEVNVRDWNWL